MQELDEEIERLERLRPFVDAASVVVFLFAIGLVWFGFY